MSQPTTLATGQLNNSDQLTVELHKPADLPAVVIITWPAAPTVASPDQFPAVVANTMKVLALARVTLTQIKATEM